MINCKKNQIKYLLPFKKVILRFWMPYINTPTFLTSHHYQWNHNTILKQINDQRTITTLHSKQWIVLSDFYSGTFTIFLNGISHGLKLFSYLLLPVTFLWYCVCWEVRSQKCVKKSVSESSNQIKDTWIQNSFIKIKGMWMCKYAYKLNYHIKP